MVNYVIMIEESRRKKQRKRKGKEIEIGRTEEKSKYCKRLIVEMKKED